MEEDTNRETEPQVEFKNNHYVIVASPLANCMAEAGKPPVAASGSDLAPLTLVIIFPAGEHS